ncbi:MAG: hypothetical protein US62_C0001G0012 [Candidatus Woesebacteria bacterium GW2011_GWA1_37_8]|uniref:Uncharacterized protein n=2 Tax=Candidatus Woeseibacteriota TaxID=1752722 RepID=A0A0G0L6Z2_9BACT|nr:MAG: hypothetical protein US62_C0001G0012 [Candidatus Woesebacteria bacterium GW2011_GWA1_37_8]KKQ87803.1 MAG: hypothetical protein UT10_C0001G0044 [Candidatus Woesebacteria bacterium GW2011_GWB1_38_8b]
MGCKKLLIVSCRLSTVLLFFAFFLLNPKNTFADSSGYPRIYNLWGNYTANVDNGYFASFNLYAMYSDGSNSTSKSRADAIHVLNPNTKILVTADIIPAHDPGSGLDVQPQWWSATPGTPDYACILRNSSGAVLRDVSYNAAYNNLGNSYCRGVLVNYFIGKWNASGGHFDGWQVDQAGDGGVSWVLGNNIDTNVDGIPDNLTSVDADYVAGMIDIFQRLRAAFPNIIIHANDSPPYYGQWVNGRLYEMDMKRYLDNDFGRPWPEIINGFSVWAQNTAINPNTTGLMNSPNGILIKTKYNFQNIWTAIKPEMMAEYGADYDRMRFGLVSSMMAGVMYSYDLGSYMYGNSNWWYDEYGTRGQISTLGYLGQPTDTHTLVSQITSPDQVVNGNFSSGTSPWFASTSGSSVIATYNVENGSAHIHLGGAASGWAVFRENYVSVETGKYYTVSFRAKASTSRNGGVRVQRAGGAWETLAQAAYNIRLFPEWNQYYYVLKATGTGTNGTLLFDLGIDAGDIYFDDIAFQEGVGGVWQRHFDNGTVLLNEGPLQQTVTLDKTYQKLNGTQAPLYFQRIDDDQATVVGSWTNPSASFDQWGLKVHSITAPNTSATLTYNFTIPYAGEYEVLAWVAPSASYSKNVTVNINGADVNLDQSVGALGWHSLGKYNFNQSATVVVKPLGSGVVIGDAIKVVSTARYNDGSTVNSITLQPNDAIVLLNSSGSSPTPTLISGDANSDGKVDGADYVIWLSNYNV